MNTWDFTQVDKGIVIGADNKGYKFIIDASDYEKVSRYYWRKHSDGYLQSDSCEIRLLHRFLLLPKKGNVVDHINHIPSDNRRCNLRVCSYSQNLHNMKPKPNKSGYCGVFWDERKRKWGARIRVNYKRPHLGYFNDKEDAYAAYCEAAKKYYGEFAYAE